VKIVPLCKALIRRKFKVLEIATGFAGLRPGRFWIRPQTFWKGGENEIFFEKKFYLRYYESSYCRGFSIML